MSVKRVVACVVAPPAATGGLAPIMASVFVAVIGLAAAVGLYAAFEWRSLFADGVHYFMSLLVTHDFVLVEPARRTVQVLQQLPTLLALWLGVVNLSVLAVVYGLTLQLLPLVLTALCYPVLPPDEKPLFIFPLAHYLLGTMAASFAPIVEGPVAAGYFWLLLFLILFARRRSALAAIVALALPALFLHETTVLLMPILALASGLQAREEVSPGRRYLFLLLAPWFAAITVVQAGFIVYPRSVERRQAALMTARVLFGIGGLNGVNVPAVLAGVAVVASTLCYRATAPATASRVVWIFGLFCAVAVLATLTCGLSGYLLAPGLQFAARNLPVGVSAPLAALLLAVRNRSAALRLHPPLLVVLLILVVGQAGWHAIAVQYWSLFTVDFRSVLASHRGYVPWREALADVSPGSAKRMERLDWGSWPNAELSILLAPRGRVRAIIGTADDLYWQPFDPRKPDELPRAAQFDYAIYLRALPGGTQSDK
jgi:hypothetical protein